MQTTQTHLRSNRHMVLLAACLTGFSAGSCDSQPDESAEVDQRDSSVHDTTEDEDDSLPPLDVPDTTTDSADSESEASVTGCPVQDGPLWPNDSYLHAGNIGPEQVRFEWRLGWGPFYPDDWGVTEDVRGYGVFLGNSCDPLATTVVDSAQIVLTNLTPDTSYVFRVEAVDGRGRWSSNGPSTRVRTECASYWSDYCPVEWPADATLTATQDGPDAVMLSWTPATDNLGIVFYRLYKDDQVVDPCCNVPSTEYTTERNVTSYRVAGLVAGTEYHFEVWARDDKGPVTVNWRTGPTLRYTLPARP